MPARGWRKPNPKTPAHRLEYIRTYEAEHREQARLRTQKWYANPVNRERARELDRLRYRELRTTDPVKAVYLARRNHLYKFGLTPEQWDALFVAQGQRCKICGSSTPQTKRGWHTDHDHKTGVVRGILCGPCNMGIGQLREDLGLLQNACLYLGADVPRVDEHW